MAGRFITFEGGEGGGKSTLIRALSDELIRAGKDVLSTREPGAGEFGAKIRTMLLDSGHVSAKSELFLFLADRANHVETVILPGIRDGKIVLCDRYTDSTLVYQSVSRGLDEKFIEAANEFATGGLKPDLTLLLDIDPHLGLQRRKDKNRLDLEPIEFHQRVREGFLALAKKEQGRIKVIDASRSIAEVFKLGLSLVSAEL